jgi:hypothetical protein
MVEGASAPSLAETSKLGFVVETGTFVKGTLAVRVSVKELGAADVAVTGMLIVGN